MRDSQGFTLIEILVVLVIIGTTLSFALLAFGDFGRSRQIRVAAEQFVQYIRMAQQIAILQDNLMGIKLDKTAYQIYRYNSDNHWVPLKGGSAYRTQNLPQHIEMNYEGERFKVPIKILIHPSGDLSPFTVKIHSASKQAHLDVHGNSHGEVVINEHP